METATLTIAQYDDTFYVKSITFIDQLGNRQYFCNIITKQMALEFEAKGYVVKHRIKDNS